jgi:hypothetical protein
MHRKIKEVKDLHDDFERYLSIIFENLVDKRICDELYDFVQIKCLTMTPEQRLHVVFEHLLSTHGPHSNLDVTQLTARVTEVSPNTMGWAKYLPEFMHAVTTLASMKQQDPSTNEVIRGLKPAPNPVPHQPLTGDPAQDNIILQNHYTATLAEQERVDKAWPLGSPELNYKPPDSQLKSALLQWVKTYSHMAINKIYADSLEHPTWTWDTIYDKLKMVVDDMSDGINPGGYRDRDRAAADAAKADKGGMNKLIRQLKKMQKPPPKDKDKSKARTAKGTTDRGSALTRSATGPAATASSSPQPRNARNTSSPTTGKADNKRDNPVTPAETEAAAVPAAAATAKTPPRPAFTALSPLQAKTSHTPLTPIPIPIDSYHSPRRVPSQGS